MKESQILVRLEQAFDSNLLMANAKATGFIKRKSKLNAFSTNLEFHYFGETHKTAILAGLTANLYSCPVYLYMCSIAIKFLNDYGR